MVRRWIVLGTLAIALNVMAAQSLDSVVDLRESGALERLEQSNPIHYEKIRRIIAAFDEQPKLAESDWLQVNVNARDVDLSRHVIRTSNPPKQLLQFTLDDTRYLMHVIRTDMAPALQGT